MHFRLNKILPAEITQYRYVALSKRQTILDLTVCTGLKECLYAHRIYNKPNHNNTPYKHRAQNTPNTDQYLNTVVH